MKPLHPLILAEGGCRDYLSNPEAIRFRNYILGVISRFPSLTVAYSAHPGIRTPLKSVVESLLENGANVFVPDLPSPISALAQSLGKRNMPLGLYLDETAEGKYRLQTVAGHGGPAGMQDVPEFPPDPATRIGVMGSTEINESYINHLKGFLDQSIEGDIRLSKLETPFTDIAAVMSEKKNFFLVIERNANGPVARISPDGQSLKITFENGRELATADMVRTIGDYLTVVRSASGTVLGPKGNDDLNSRWGDHLNIEGGLIEMSYLAASRDLLLGWDEPGILAHQGNGAFGDAYLTLCYLLEAWNSVEFLDLRDSYFGSNATSPST